MMTSILGIIAGVATIAGGIMAYKNSANRQRRNAEKDIREKEAEMQSKVDEIRKAVYSNDEPKINELAAKLLAPVFAALMLVGCATNQATVYIPTDRKIEACTNSLGIACQAVPNAVFCELLEKAQELKDLKTEMAVDKRLDK